MHARITRYKMNPAKIPAAIDTMNRMKDQILGMPGTLHFINTVDDDGNGVVIALLDSAERVDANAEKVAAIWQHFADYLEEPPQPGSYGVIANWENGG